MGDKTPFEHLLDRRELLKKIAVYAPPIVFAGRALISPGTAFAEYESSGSGYDSSLSTETESSGSNVLAGQFAVAMSLSRVLWDVGAAVKVTALDASGHVVTDFVGPVTLTDLSGTVSAGPFTWVDGVGMANVAFSAAYNPNQVTATGLGGATGTSGTFDLIGPVSHFLVGMSASSIAAGTAATIKITAQDSLNQTVTDYAGSVALSDLSGSLSLVGPVSWNAGVGTVSVEFAVAFNPDRVTVTDTVSGVTGTSGTFDLVGPVDHFLVGMSASSIAVGSAATVKITAQDSLNQTVKTYSGTIVLSDLSGSLSVLGPITWSGGVATVSVSFGAAFNPDRVTATDSVSGATGTSGTFQVKPVSSGTPGTPLPGGL